MVKHKVRKKKQSEANYEDLSLEVNCCVPTGFECEEPGVVVTQGSCVRLTCSLTVCPLSGLLHQGCFRRLEAWALSALANSKGRARDWSSKEREKNLWHDRGYDLVYRMFPCQCGHGFLRKVEDQDTTVNQGNTARKKKKQNEKPKLNSKPKPLSQKGVAEYFSEASEKVSTVRSAVPMSYPRMESAKIIPGLSVEGQKPLRLNMDLPAIQLTESKPANLPAQGRPENTGDGQPRPRTASLDVEEIFNSDDDLEEEVEEEEKKQNETEQSNRLFEEIVALGLENEKLKEKMMAERRLYQEYQEELMREKQKLEMESRDMERSMQKLKSDLQEKLMREKLKLEIKSRDLDRSMQKLKSDLQEKDGERIETIEELNKLVKNSSAETEEEQVKGIFVSEKSLLRLAGKLGVSDEISARLQSSQSENEVGIVERELEIEVNLENNLFRKMVNNITSCFLLR